MSRPLKQKGIAELEELFSANQTHVATLRALGRELEHRDTARAKNLMSAVRSALAARRGAFAPVASQQSSEAAGAAASDGSADSEEEAADSVDSPSSKASGQSEERETSSAPVQEPPLPAPPPQPEPVAATVTAPAAEQPMAIPEPQTAPQPAARAIPAMSTDEAYHLLGVTKATPWRKIEERRRDMVRVAHPSKLQGVSPVRREVTLGMARRVNAAYGVLSSSHQHQAGQ